MLENKFLVKANTAQRPPTQAEWRTWLFMGGRGAGKTRAGAEWLRYNVLHNGYSRAALVGPTLSDVREVMIEGPSGLKAVAAEEGPPHYEVSRRRLVWSNGAEAYVFSAEDPDSLRGPQFDIAWCDEAAVWPKGQKVWDTLQMALRLGDDPRAMVTTTPRPVELIKALVADESVAVTRAATADNAGNLAPGFLATMQRAYGGTRLGRQELEGELIEDLKGALWTRDSIDAARVTCAPALQHVLVAVDPPVSVGPDADACGIVAAGLSEDAGELCRAYVLADASVQGFSPLDWARRVAALVDEVGAGEVIAEANQGGEMVRHALETAGCNVPVRLVHARTGKLARAMPVAALYEAGRVAHVGTFAPLEDEMCSYDGSADRCSPDRMDALVWALRTLMLNRPDTPRIRDI